MIIILVFSLASLTLYSSALFIKDLINKKNQLETETQILPTSIIGFIAYFFDTLGCSDNEKDSFGLISVKANCP